MSDVLFERLFEDVYWPEDDLVQPADPSCEQHHTEPDSTTSCLPLLLQKVDDVSADQAGDKSQPDSPTPSEVSAFTTQEVHQTNLCGTVQTIMNPATTTSQTMGIAQLVDVDVLLAQIQEPIPKSQLPQMELYPGSEINNKTSPVPSLNPLLDANVADQAGPSANQLACQQYRERRKRKQENLIKELGILKKKIQNSG